MNAQLEQQIKAVTDTVTRIVTALTSFLLSLPMLGTAITAVVGIIGGFGLALRSATSEATALARSLSQMRAANGYSLSQGYDLQRRFGAIGISGSDTASLFSQPGNNAFGFAARGVNPRDLAGMAGQYQATANSGLFGRELANARLAGQFGGNVPDSVRQALSDYSPGQIRSQQAYSDQINGSLGINPNVLREYVTNLALLQARVSTTFDAIKVRLGVQLLPMLEQAFGGIADYLVTNADKIAEAVQQVGQWLMTLPSTLMRFGAGVLRAFAGVMDGIGGFLDFLSTNAPNIAGFLQGLSNTLVGLGEVVSGVVATITPLIEGARRLWNGATGGAGIPASSTPTNQASTSNAETGGSLLPWGIGAFLARNPIARGIGALGRAILPFVPGGSTVTAVASAAGSNPYAYGLPAGRAAIPGTLPAAAQSGAAGFARTLGLRGLMAAARLPVIGAGIGLGVLGYEGMRATNMFGLGSNRSIAEMLGMGGGGDEGGAALASVAPPQRAGGGSQLASTISRALGNGGNNARSGAAMLRDLAGSLENGAAGYDNEIKEILKSIDKRAAGIEKNSDKQAQTENNQQLAAIIRDFGARVAAYISEDAALNQLRI